jgi:hypothetical protein
MNKSIRFLVFLLILGTLLAGAPPTTSILAPVGGEYWVIGSEHGIAWTTIKGHPGTAYIGLWGYNKANQLIHLGEIAAADYQKGSFIWKVGALTDRKVGQGRYHIRIAILCPSLPRMQAWLKNPIHLSAFPLPRSMQRD